MLTVVLLTAMLSLTSGAGMLMAQRKEAPRTEMSFSEVGHRDVTGKVVVT